MEGRTYESLSVIAKKITGTSWNGPRFFGLREGHQVAPPQQKLPARSTSGNLVEGPPSIHTRAAVPMKSATAKRQRCAIYTRKSTEHNLDLAFNSLDAQREACEAYIKSQAHEGWGLVPTGSTMAACPAPRWSALPCNRCWTRCGPKRSISSSSIRSTG